MYKKINILDICVDNYSVRESLLRLDTFMSNTVLNIIETVTMEKLVSAGEYPVIKECLEQADLCIIGEREILSESGNDTAQRVREVCGQDFLRELLKRVVRSKKSRNGRYARDVPGICAPVCGGSKLCDRGMQQ